MKRQRANGDQSAKRAGRSASGELSRLKRPWRGRCASTGCTGMRRWDAPRCPSICSASTSRSCPTRFRSKALMGRAHRGRGRVTEQSADRFRVVVVGSCVSRDIFASEPAGARTFEVVDYYARSSLAVTTLPSCAADVPLDRIASPFQRRIVRRDLARSLGNDLPDMTYDALVLDLIDERFDLYEFAPGSIATASNEFVQTGLAPSGRRVDSRWIRSGSPAH